MHDSMKEYADENEKNIRPFSLRVLARSLSVCEFDNSECKRWKECRRLFDTQNSNDFKFSLHVLIVLAGYLKVILRNRSCGSESEWFLSEERAKHERFHHFLRIYAYTTAKKHLLLLHFVWIVYWKHSWFLLTKFIDKFLLRRITVWSWKLNCLWLTNVSWSEFGSSSRSQDLFS